MGMFDSIKVRMPLPAEYAAYQHDVFQTKDLYCRMDCYVILADGRLAHRPLQRWIVDYHHGPVCFYRQAHSTLPPELRQGHGMVEFTAWFRRGQCVEILAMNEVVDIGPDDELAWDPWKDA